MWQPPSSNNWPTSSALVKRCPPFPAGLGAGHSQFTVTIPRFHHHSCGSPGTEDKLLLPGDFGRARGTLLPDGSPCIVRTR
jgi:hypothetical protein